MTDTKDIHSGHRKRMFAKYLASNKDLPDHELLEILLFFAIPRANTNNLAHLLLRRFGNIEKIFETKPEELASIDGIGLKTAEFLSVLGQILSIIRKRTPTKRQKALSSFDKNKDDAIAFFKNVDHEKTYISLLDKNYVEITRICYEQKEKTSVNALINDVAKAFALNKPCFVLIAHNHPSGLPTPSTQDDFTTAKLNMLCNVHGVTLVDHIIVAGKETLSYFSSGRLQDIKQKFNIDNLISKF